MMFTWKETVRHWIRMQPTDDGDSVWINVDRIAAVTEIAKNRSRVVFDTGHARSVEVEHSAQEVMEKICGDVSENKAGER
jgi:hypothetical protein